MMRSLTVAHRSTARGEVGQKGSWPSPNLLVLILKSKLFHALFTSILNDRATATSRLLNPTTICRIKMESSSGGILPVCANMFLEFHGLCKLI